MDLFDLEQPIRSQLQMIHHLHEWLESLAHGRPDWRARGNARDDVAQHVLPAVADYLRPIASSQCATHCSIARSHERPSARARAARPIA